MIFAIYTTNVSPHLMPFVEEVKRQRPDVEVKFIVRGYEGLKPREKISPKKGWDEYYRRFESIRAQDDWDLTWRILREADVLLCGFREPALFEERVKAGRLTYYNSERWLKPYDLGRIRLPGIVRMAVPWFNRLVRRTAKLIESGNFVLLPIGCFAARDIARLMRLARGDLRCLFRCPKVPFEKKLFAEVDGCRQIRLWAYFVSPGTLAELSRQPGQSPESYVQSPLPTPATRLLWLGRTLDWKRVDTIIAAVKGDRRYRLTILGCGEEDERLRALAAGADNITFHEPVDLEGVRRIMRGHDILVLGSNSREGWGAVVSEAVEEGMKVVGTYEAGSSATVLPESNLFHAGDVAGLRRALEGGPEQVEPTAWSAKAAAAAFIKDWSERHGK